MALPLRRIAVDRFRQTIERAGRGRPCRILAGPGQVKAGSGLSVGADLQARGHLGVLQALTCYNDIVVLHALVDDAH